MFPWESNETTPVQRWGLAYLFLALGFEFLGRRGLDVTTFCVDGLAILAAAFVGPAVVQLTSHLLRREWDGLLLGLITLLTCTVITLALALFFRCFY